MNRILVKTDDFIKMAQLLRNDGYKEVEISYLDQDGYPEEEDFLPASLHFEVQDEFCAIDYESINSVITYESNQISHEFKNIIVSIGDLHNTLTLLKENNLELIDLLYTPQKEDGNDFYPASLKFLGYRPEEPDVRYNCGFVYALYDD